MPHDFEKSRCYTYSLTLTFSHFPLSLSFPFLSFSQSTFFKWSRVERFLLQRRTDDELQRDNFLRRRPLSWRVSELDLDFFPNSRRCLLRVERRADADALNRRRVGWWRPSGRVSYRRETSQTGRNVTQVLRIVTASLLIFLRLQKFQKGISGFETGTLKSFFSKMVYGTLKICSHEKEHLSVWQAKL